MIKTRCPALLFLATITYAALPLPSYIEPCSLHDPNFDACVLAHGKAAIPHLVKGDRKYGVPPLDPFEISEITLPSSGIAITLNNVKAYGLKDVDLKKVKYNFKQNEVTYEMVLPIFEILGQYEMSGKVLLLPINGKGDMNLTVDNVKVNTRAHIKTVEIEGREHIEFSNFSTQVDPKRVYFNFTNLFNGNKLLGEEMNALLNREWGDAFKEFGPPILEATNSIIGSITSSFARVLPLDVWFPENAKPFCC